MRPKRPTPVLVIAILHFIGGGIGLMGTICGGVLLLAGGNKMLSGMGGGSPQARMQIDYETDKDRYLGQHLPSYNAFQGVNLVASGALGVMMVVSGIGLLGLRPWARTLSLVYAGLSILNHLVSAIYVFGFYLPAMRDFNAQEVAQRPETANYASIMGTTETLSYSVSSLF